MSTQNPTSMNRRTFMKTTGLAAGSAIVGPNVINSVTAYTEDSDTPQYDSLDYLGRAYVLGGIPSFMAGKKAATGVISALAGNEDAVEEAAELSIHQMSESAYMKWGHMYNILSNWGNDQNLIADVDARHAIANAWEQDKSVVQAQTDCHNAIEDYLVYPYRNALIAKLTNLFDIAGARNLAEETGSVDNDDWIYWGLVDDDITNGEAQIGKCHIKGKTGTDHTASFVLPNGESHELETVSFTAQTKDGQVWESKFDQDFIDNYDENSESWTFQFDGDASFESDFNLNSSNVSTDNETFPTSQVGDLVELMEILNKIEDKISTIKGNYTESFVQQIYDALDSGQLNPNDVRGITGLVRHLSGTNDAQDGRYQVAFSSLVGDGAVTPDPSVTSRIDMQLTGWKNTVRSGDFWNFRDYAEQQEKSGMIFGQSPESDIQDGEYMINTPICITGNNALEMFSGKGKKMYYLQNLDINPTQISFAPNCKTFITSNSNKTQIRKMTDGTKLNTLDKGYGTFIINNLLIAENDGIEITDVSGNSIMQKAGYSIRGDVKTPNPNKAYIEATNNGNGEQCIIELNITVEDSIAFEINELITETSQGGAKHMALDYENNTLVSFEDYTDTSNGWFAKISLESKNIQWTAESGNNDVVSDIALKNDIFTVIHNDGVDNRGWLNFFDISGDSKTDISTNNDIFKGAKVDSSPSGEYLITGNSTKTPDGTHINNTDLDSTIDTSQSKVKIANSQRVNRELRNADIVVLEEDRTSSYDFTGKLIINHIVNSDGEEVDDPVNWEPRKYSTTDVGEYADYTSEVTNEQGDAYDEAENPDPDVPGAGSVSDFFDNLIDNLTNIPQWIIYGAIGVVALVAGLFGINVLGTVTGGD